MKTFLKLALVALGATISGHSVAATANSTVTVSATLVASCEVSSAATIGFGNVTSAGNATANSGNTFQVACGAGATPQISATGAHTLVDVATGTVQVPFNLSLTNGGADNFPTGTGTTLDIVMDGTPKPVTLYAVIPAANLNAKPNGAYSAAVIVTVDY